MAEYLEAEWRFGIVVTTGQPWAAEEWPRRNFNMTFPRSISVLISLNMTHHYLLTWIETTASGGTSQIRKGR